MRLGRKIKCNCSTCPAFRNRARMRQVRAAANSARPEALQDYRDRDLPRPLVRVRLPLRREDVYAQRGEAGWVAT